MDRPGAFQSRTTGSVSILNTRRKSLAYSSGSIVTPNIAGPASVWRFANAWLNSTEAESGSNPKSGRGQPSSSQSPSESPVTNPRQLILLLAEDNLPDALMVREAILGENLPVQVNVMPDGERLIDYLTKAGMDPDVPLPNIIMLDLNLPKIHGLDVLRRIRAWDNYKDIPVLIITSSDAATDRGEALRLGAGYFRKPPNYEQFLKLGGMLKQFLAEKGML